MRKFHAAVRPDDAYPPGRVAELRLYECWAVDCQSAHVYELDKFEGQALRDLIDERRMKP